MEGQYNMRSPAVKRLMREAQELSEPTEQYYAQPLEDNLFEWHFTIRGPADTDFNEGIYHGRIVLPPDYPMKPPSIILLTPNGRFEVNRKICLSISGHHPESWQPSWSIRTALLAIIGFMPTHGGGAIGSLNYTAEERKVLAKKSQMWRCPTCGDVTTILKPVTEESEKTQREAQELASQIDFKGENKGEKKSDQESPSPASQSESTPTSTSPPATEPTSTAPAANGGGAVPSHASFPPFPWPMAGMFPGPAPMAGHAPLFMPGAFPLPGQVNPAALASFPRFPLPSQFGSPPFHHPFPPMYPHGFPLPYLPSAFPPGLPYLPFPPPPGYGAQAAAVPIPGNPAPVSSPSPSVAPAQGAAGVSGSAAGGQGSVPTPGQNGSGTSSPPQSPAGATASPGMSAAAAPAAEGQPGLQGQPRVQSASNPALRQRRAQQAAAEHQEALEQERRQVERRVPIAHQWEQNRLNKPLLLVVLMSLAMVMCVIFRILSGLGWLEGTNRFD